MLIPVNQFMTVAIKTAEYHHSSSQIPSSTIISLIPILKAFQGSEELDLSNPSSMGSVALLLEQDHQLNALQTLALRILFSQCATTIAIHHNVRSLRLKAGSKFNERNFWKIY